MVTKEQIKQFPDAPGAYLMKDAKGRVIYVGKALSLKKRIASYFLKNQPSLKNEVMLGYVASIETIETSSEHEAFILEAELIKRYKPRFNISLKDDKSFPYIKVTREAIPRVSIGRRKKGEEAVDHYGPYTDSKLLRRALDILRRIFPFCTCRRLPKKVCLNYHMGLCAGPYQKKVSLKRYREIIGGLEDFLMKKDTELIEELSRRMRRLVGEEKFEEAAKVRDQLEALSLLSARAYDDFGAIGLKTEPRRVEAFDISNLRGDLAVGSMVSFAGGKPDKDNYRRFKIKTVRGADDYAMIREVVRRRYERLLSERSALPDLIVIDGGLGHLEAGVGILRELKVNIPIIAIAKSEELIYTVKHKNGVRLGRDSRVLRLVQSVRDEAHRFALKYHHFLRKKNVFGRE